MQATDWIGLGLIAGPVGVTFVLLILFSAAMHKIMLCAVGLVVGVLVHALASTWRYRLGGWQRLRALIAGSDPIVGGMFHGRQMCMLNFFSRPGQGPWTIMVSRSRDGDLQAAGVGALGYGTVRGSSGRGGSRALADLVGGMRRGDFPRAVFAMDGSRGPRYQAKPGILSLASQAQAKLVTVMALPQRAWVLQRSWDHTMIPAPWTRILMHCSRPIHIPPGLSGAAIERLQPRLQALLDAQRLFLDQQAGVRRRL